MYEGMGKAVDALYKALFASIIIAWPLAIWKIIEILIWIMDHVNIEISF